MKSLNKPLKDLIWKDEDVDLSGVSLSDEGSRPEMDCVPPSTICNTTPTFCNILPPNLCNIDTPTPINCTDPIGLQGVGCSIMVITCSVISSGCGGPDEPPSMILLCGPCA